MTSAFHQQVGRRAPVLQDHGVKDFSTDQAASGGKPLYTGLVLQIIPYHQASASKTIHIRSVCQPGVGTSSAVSATGCSLRREQEPQFGTNLTHGILLVHERHQNISCHVFTFCMFVPLDRLVVQVRYHEMNGERV